MLHRAAMMKPFATFFMTISKPIHAGAVLSVLFGALASGAKKPPTPAVDYPTFRVLPASCDSAWPAAIKVLTQTGFVPQSSDKAGGILSLAWGKGDSGWSAADRDAKMFTKARIRFPAYLTRFRINPSSAIFSPDGEGCRVQLMISFVAWKESFEKGWVALESNGAIEDKMLGLIEEQVKGAAK